MIFYFPKLVKYLFASTCLMNLILTVLRLFLQVETVCVTPMVLEASLPILDYTRPQLLVCMYYRIRCKKLRKYCQSESSRASAYISICNTLVSSTSISLALNALIIFCEQCSHYFIAALLDKLSKGISYPMWSQLTYFFCSRYTSQHMISDCSFYFIVESCIGLLMTSFSFPRFRIV